jgi:hypothetical protein
MYEDEEGRWQNRLEALWVSIDDRSLQTQGKTVALFNKVASIVERALDIWFGQRLISVRSVFGSINMTAAVTLILNWLYSEGGHPYRTALFGVVGSLSLIVPFLSKRLWARILFFLPTPLFAYSLIIQATSAFNDRQVILAFATLIPSILTDFGAILITRKLLGRIATTASLSRTIATTLSLLGVSIAVIGIPAALIFAFSEDTLGPYAYSIIYSLGFYNLPSSVYTLIAGVVLCALLLHRAFWPVFARLVYPLTRNLWISNRAFASSVGVLCFTFAFNIEKIGWKAILELLKP